MAGFLFKKQKQDLNNNKKTSIVISAPTTLQPGPNTPVYARFSASTSNPVARKVSAPKPLGIQGRSHRGENLDGKYGYSTNSLTSVDRPRDLKIQDVAQQSQPRQPLVDKPLPPPVPPTEDKPTSRSTAVPPSAFPIRQQSSGRMSLDSQKPLPRPGSSQSFLANPGIPPSPPSKITFSRTRSTSVTPPSISSSSIALNTDSQTKIQRQWSRSTSNKKAFEDPSQPDLTASMKTGDSTAGTSENGFVGETLVPTLSSTSLDSISSTRRSASQRAPSERVMDHSETLSPQNSNEVISVPSQPSSFNSRQPMLERGGSSASGKSFDRQSFVSIPSVKEGGGEMTLLRPPSKPPTPRRGLPSPPSTPMGSNASSLSRASVTSAYHELYPSHVIMDSGRPYSVQDPNQQQPPRLRNQSIAQPSPLSPPPTNTLHAGLQNGIYERQSLHLSQRRNQQHLYPEHQPEQVAFTSHDPNPVSFAQSPSLQSNLPSMPRGKPRIFAAMETQENGRLQPFPNSSPQLLQAPSHTRHSLVDEFSTPKSQFESLPEITPNGDVDYSSTSKTIDTHDVSALEPPPIQPRKPSASRSAARQDDSRKQIPSQTLRTKKLSKARQPSDSIIHGHTPNGSTSTLPGTPDPPQPRKIHKVQSKSRLVASEPEPVVQVDEETIRNAGIPLDDDPFARVEGVKMLKPNATSSVRHKASKENRSSIADDYEAKEASGRSQPQENGASQTRLATDSHRHTKKERKDKPAIFFLDPTSKRAPPEPATMSKLLLDPQILACLLQYLTFYEWCILLSLSKEIRSALVRNAGLREAALERFLRTVGYSRWTWEDEPLSLSLQDLSDYMRGVSTPTHEYSRAAATYIHSLKLPTTHRDPAIRQMVQRFVASTRAYNRVLLRLRAQAEKEATLQPSTQAQMQFSAGGRAANARLSPTTRGGNSSRPSSRAPSPVSLNHSSSGHFPGSLTHANTSQTNLAARSPLFKLRRAPLLRVFVPSPEGDWLSDKSVLECEAECKRAGVQHLLRLGDVVWDVAVGDEGNVGRLVWDGTYLIDLDYTYSAIGELPKYIHALAFPPSYFHRVIRTGHTSSNPIVHIDITPWGQEIATNLQLIQDRVRTETPQGAHHNVMRWVHRSSFLLRPVRGQQPGMTNRIPILNTDNLFVDAGWYGTIVVETEGTNEALADLQDRCGLGAFPPRPRAHVKPIQAQIENRKVFRILRERSRPGEIWICAVSMKERLL